MNDHVACRRSLRYPGHELRDRLMYRSQTWDRPCHGSVYEADGSVIHGPTRKPLQAHPL